MSSACVGGFQFLGTWVLPIIMSFMFNLEFSKVAALLRFVASFLYLRTILQIDCGLRVLLRWVFMKLDIFVVVLYFYFILHPICFWVDVLICGLKVGAKIILH